MSNKRARTSGMRNVGSRPFRMYRPRGLGYRTHGSMYMPRGTESGIALMGATYKTANAHQRAMRKATGWVGRGSYRSAYRIASRLGKTTLGRMARRAGTAFLDAETGGMGSLAIRSAREFGGRGMYTGRGLYKASSANILVAGGKGSVAGFNSASDETGALTINHTEYIQDIYGLEAGETFHVTALRLNPGLHQTFPWLSQIAANYEEYELIQLLFQFESKISDQMSGSNGQVGSIIMFTDYGPDSTLKTSKYTMLQGYASGDALLTNNLVHGVECDPRKLHGDGHKYIRTSALEGSLNDYDLGVTQIGVSGTPSTLQNQIVGQIHVTYTVKLMKPRIYSALALAVAQDIWTSNGVHNDDGAKIFATPLLPGIDNGIGTDLEIETPGAAVDLGHQTDLQTNNVRLTFPASFAGAVEIIITTEADAAGAGNNVQTSMMPCKNVELTGNIKPIRDMLIGFGEPAGDDESNFATGQPAYWQQISGVDGRISRFHFFVEMADSGVDNTILFRMNQLSNVATADGPIQRTVLEVRRYNNRESTKPPLFLDATGHAVKI